MATAIKECRVCGKKYEACRTSRRTDGVFHWRDVACSEECGQKYLHDVLLARGLIVDEPEAEAEEKPVSKKKRKKEEQ